MSFVFSYVVRVDIMINSPGAKMHWRLCILEFLEVMLKSLSVYVCILLIYQFCDADCIGLTLHLNMKT